MAAQSLFSFESPDDSLGFMLWQVSNHWQREIKKALDQFGLTHAQFVVLASAYWLGQQGNVTQTTLAAHARTDKMMTSKLLRTLESKGYLQRIEDATDTRAKSISLTSVGVRLAVQAAWAVEEFETKFFASLPADTALLQQLKTLLPPVVGEELPASKEIN
ncbi:MarR family winged helix-turn-helix transcriptional regulator [Hymenobacter sp. HD11105]